MLQKNALSSQPFGYKTKPLRVYAVALYFLLAPFFNFVLSLKFKVHDPGWMNPSVWWDYLTIMRPRLIVLLILTLSSGILLLLVRRSSWIIAITTLVLVILYNIIILEALPYEAFVLLAFVVLTPFRRPYLNPATRWWEQSPRFEVDIFAAVPETQSKIHVYDISQGGILGEYIGTPHPIMYSEFYVELPQGPKLLCEVVRVQENKFLGLHFKKVSRAQFKHLRSFINSLERKGVARILARSTRRKAG